MFVAGLMFGGWVALVGSLVFLGVFSLGFGFEGAVVVFLSVLDCGNGEMLEGHILRANENLLDPLLSPF